MFGTEPYFRMIEWRPGLKGTRLHAVVTNEGEQDRAVCGRLVIEPLPLPASHYVKYQAPHCARCQRITRLT